MILAVARPQFFVRAEGSGRNSRVPKRRLKPADVKVAIQHAQLVCYNYEDTPACRVAWDQVEEVAGALARQREQELLLANILEQCEEDPLACREYDL